MRRRRSDSEASEYIRHDRTDAGRQRKALLPAATALSWDHSKVTVHCPFCGKTHNHAISHFKHDLEVGWTVQDSFGRYAYDGPSSTRCDSRVSHCQHHHLNMSMEYVILFPFEDDIRVAGLSFELLQTHDSEGAVVREEFRTVGLDTTPSTDLEVLESCYSDETDMERELRLQMQSTSLHDGDYDVTSTFEVYGEIMKDTQRASVWLAASACAGDLDELKRLLENSPNQNALLQYQDTSGQSLLGLAVPNGHYAVAEYLLEVGSDVNVRDAKGRTPLMEAALWGYPAIVKMLLNAGARKDLKDRRDMTAGKLAEESDRNDGERHERSAKYLEDPTTKKRDRTLIRGLLGHGLPASSPAALHPSDLIDAYFYKSPAAGTISLILPKQGIEILRQVKTAAILIRSEAFPIIAAVSGRTSALLGEFRLPEAGFERLNEGHWGGVENFAVARDIDFSFRPHPRDQSDVPGSFNASHAEAQLMCFFVRRNYLFRRLEQEPYAITDDLLQLFMLQRRNRLATILISKAPCESCLALRDCISEKLEIDFTFRHLPAK